MGEINIPSGYEQTLQADLRRSIEMWQKETVSLLPTLPNDINVQFDNEYLVPGFGTGGATSDLHSMKLAYDSSFASQEELLAELRGTYFHESYHLARGFSFETTPNDLPAIKMAIEEGAATKFEVLRAGSTPGYSKYEARDTMLAWLKEVKELPDGFDYDWQRWKFFDPGTGRKWILYKVGVFIVDEALKNNPKLTIEGMSALSPEEILTLSRL